MRAPVVVGPDSSSSSRGTYVVTIVYASEIPKAGRPKISKKRRCEPVSTGLLA